MYYTMRHNGPNLEDPLCAWLGEDELVSFIPWLRWLTCESDQILFEQESSVLGGYLLYRGAIQLIKRTLSGSKLLVRYLKSSEWIATDFMNDEHRHHFMAQAIIPSRVRFVGQEALVAMVERFPKFAKIIQHQSEMDRKVLEEKLLLYSRGSAKSKVAALLLELASAYGTAHPKGLRLTVPVRGAAMSELIAMNPATFSKCLMDFERRGWIIHAGSQVWVRQENELRRVVEE